MTADRTTQVVLVTGAARGIGLAIARQLVRQGVSLVLSDVDEDNLEAAAAELRRDGRSVRAVPCDVSSPTSVQGLFDATLEAHGRLDGLVNNAGIGGVDKMLLELSLEEWEEMLRVDLTSVFLTCSAALPAMIRQGRGRIVNIASISALMGVSGSTHYSAAKAGVIAFSKSLAREVAQHRINVNVVAPGLIDTVMSRRRGIDHQRHLIPWPRIGTPEDVAGIVAFLLSDDAEFMTGQVLHPNGGAYM